MRSLRLSDELAASAAARGIDNPGPRSCARPVRIRPVDMVAMATLCALGGAIAVFYG
jgi:energy-coupling factor transporter transmembrane protein EcfT